MYGIGKELRIVGAGVVVALFIAAVFNFSGLHNAVLGAGSASSVYRDTDGFIRPLQVLDYIKSNYFVATSTSQASIFPYATTTVTSADRFCLTGDLPCISAWPTGGGSFPFTPTTNFGALTNATATPIWFQAGLQSSSTIQAKNVNIDQFSRYQQNGNDILFASSTNSGTFVGNNAGSAILADGIQNTFVGHDSGLHATSTDNNTGVGFRALRGTAGNAHCTNSVAIGSQTLQACTEGSGNVAVGQTALLLLTSGDNNVALGRAAGDSITTGSSNVCLGNASCNALTTGSGNFCLGNQSCNNNVTGSSNVGVGVSTLLTATTSINNTGIGGGVMDVMISCHRNDVSSEASVGIGFGALGSLTCSGSTVAVGTLAADNLTTGSGVFIGHNIDAPSTTDLGQLVIQNTIYGTGVNATGATVDTDAMIGIGTTTPYSRFHVTQGANATSTVTIGEIGLSTSKGCVNMNTSAGGAASFYINAAGVMVVENNYCR